MLTFLLNLHFPYFVIPRYEGSARDTDYASIDFSYLEMTKRFVSPKSLPAFSAGDSSVREGQTTRYHLTKLSIRTNQ